jgi:phage tail sheath gpL-like
MPVEFAQFPADWKQPLYWVEIDPSMAGLPTTPQICLLVGQMLPTGNAAHDIPIQVGTLADAKALFGEGSMLANMFECFMSNNFAQPMAGLPLSDPVGGTPASGTITVATAPTQAGTLSLYIAARLVSVNVSQSDTVDQVAAKIVTACQDDPDLPVTVTQGGTGTGSVHIVCNWPGQSGNDIDVRDSYKGSIAGEMLPVGMTMTYPANNKLAGGAGTPDMTKGIAALADEPYEYVALPYNDGTSIQAWAMEYGFGDTGRWGWMRQQYGLIFSAYRGTFSNTITWGNTNNEGTISWMGVEMSSPSPVWDWASAYCAMGGRAFLNDPARPLQTLQLTNILSAPKHDRYTVSERNTLAHNGIATQTMGSNGWPIIMRETTGYQLNLYGYGDDAYELLTRSRRWRS